MRTTVQTPAIRDDRRHYSGAAIRRFMFATGIENSYPVITGRGGKDLRVDEMAKCDHYKRWREDFDLVAEQGLEFLRYGPPYYRVHEGPEQYDWSFADETFHSLRERGITPIADLCHFGVPDWVGGFQNKEWPEHFARYARAFASRFPWVQLYTPVNEIYLVAAFSAHLGWWNERLASDRSFVTALRNVCRATLLAEQAILEAQPNAIFVQSESTQYFHPKDPDAYERAKFLDELRFVALDMIYGHDVTGSVYRYLTDNGLSADEYHWQIENGRRYRAHCIMGNDYYGANEQMVPADEDKPPAPAGEIFGYYGITSQYQQRYRLPVMHTETNVQDNDKAPDWLNKEWYNVVRLRREGVPILGFTWYSLTDQVDWDTHLREDNGNDDPCGLYDLQRNVRPVGNAYKKLIKVWGDIIQKESLAYGLDMPLVS